MTEALQTLSHEESELLLYAIRNRYTTEPQQRKAVRNYCMAVLMLDAGLRVGELVGLHYIQLWYADCPLGALSIKTEKQKLTTHRTIPVTERIHNSIIEMQWLWWKELKFYSTAYAFFNTQETAPLTTRQVERIINTAARQSIGRPIHPHVLRHTFATRLMKTCPIRVVQQLLGHASVSSTQVYQHPNSQDLQQAIDTLNEKPTEPVSKTVKSG